MTTGISGRHAVAVPVSSSPATSAAMPRIDYASPWGRRGQAAPACVLALIRDRRVAARVAQALRPDIRVEVCATLTDLSARWATSSLPVAAVLLEPRDDEGLSVATWVGRHAAAATGVPCLGLCEAGYAHSADILTLARAGVTDIVFHADLTAGASWVTTVRRAGRATQADALLTHLRAIVDPAAIPILRRALALAPASNQAQALASAMQVSPGTVRARCRAAGLPHPHVVLMWMRLLVAAHLLDTSELTVEGVAEVLDFQQAAVLRNAFKRYTGRTASALRAAGAVATVLAGFAAALASGSHPGPAVAS